MRAIQIDGFRKISMIDAPVPDLEEGQVLVKCSYVALCGSNMGQYTSEGVWGDLEFPNPAGWAGHENIGTVVKSRCDEWSEGDLVLAQPVGYYGFAEYIVATPPGIAALPKDAPDIAALIVAQPLATILRAMTFTENVINARCAVIGQGPMGLIWTKFLGMLGAKQVVATDLIPWRLEWAAKYGAQATIDASSEDTVARSKELTDGELFDFVVDAAAPPESLNTAAAIVNKGGRLFVFGMPDYDNQEFPWHSVFRNETKILTCVGPECAEHFQTAADMVVDGRASDLGDMVTPRMAWDRAEEAFEMYADCAEGSLKLTLEL